MERCFPASESEESCEFDVLLESESVVVDVLVLVISRGAGRGCENESDWLT